MYGSSDSPCFTLATGEAEAVEGGLIYPNASSGTLFWDEPIAAIRIFDVTGKLVLQSVEAQNCSPLSVEELETGLYTVVIERDDVYYSQKLVVQRQD